MSDITTPAAAALRYAGKLGWPVFPRRDRQPLTDNGFKDATTDPVQIAQWWTRWPFAQIAMPTGSTSGIVVLDIDRKHGNDGFATLERYNRHILPETPMAHTPHAGLHVYFALNPKVTIGFIQGKYGLDKGLDVLGEGASVALPTPGTGYRWDPQHHPGNCVPLIAPGWLSYHRKSTNKHTDRHGRRLDPADVLITACQNIRQAGPGDRHAVLNREAFLIGCIVASGGLEQSNARHELQAAASAMTWGSHGNVKKAGRDLDDAFKDGLNKGGRRR